MESLSQFSVFPDEILIEIFRKAPCESIFKLVLEDMKNESFFSSLISVDELWLSLIRENFPYVSKNFSLPCHLLKGKYPWREFENSPFDRFLCLVYLSKFNGAIKGGFLKSKKKYMVIGNEIQSEVPESIHSSLFFGHRDLIFKAKFEPSHGKYTPSHKSRTLYSLHGKIIPENGFIELRIRSKVEVEKWVITDTSVNGPNFGIISKNLGEKFPLWIEKRDRDYAFEYPKTIIPAKTFNGNRDLFTQTLFILDSEVSINDFRTDLLTECKSSTSFYQDLFEKIFKK